MSAHATLAACRCVTALGHAGATCAALLEGRRALEARPARGAAGGDLVPLALLPGRALDETLPPSWLRCALEAFPELSDGGWGRARRPVVVSSSNFGIGNLYALSQGGAEEHKRFGAPPYAVRALRENFGWGPAITTFSHACVSSQLALVHAARLLETGAAESVLVFTFDLLSPFVAAGFHALKILNQDFPAPFADRPSGSIGLGDGLGYAVLQRSGPGVATVLAHSLDNELHHATANAPDGSGFRRCLGALEPATRGRRLWIKGHGTGTLEAGRLEAGSCRELLPEAPLVGWKGSLGHTLGSCGLVELAIALEAMRLGRIPGTPGSSAPYLADNVASGAFDAAGYDAVLCLSNAFGGAHAATLVELSDGV